MVWIKTNYRGERRRTFFQQEGGVGMLEPPVNESIQEVSLLYILNRR